jgi:Transposase DDE domain
MYIATVPNRGSPPAILLRESYREGNQVKTRTVANLSHWPAERIPALRRCLKGEFDGQREAAAPVSDRIFGVLFMLKAVAERLGIVRVLGQGRAGKLALFLVLARVAARGSRLSAVRWAEEQAVAEVLGLSRFDEEDLYAALDWLAEQQPRLEQQLYRGYVKRVGQPPVLVLYDVTSSYLEGECTELAEYGYNRDGKKGKKQIVIGLLTAADGEPLAVKVFPGNTSDCTTVAAQIETLKHRFKVAEVVFVGDRGMVKTKGKQALSAADLTYITALTDPQVRKLLKHQVLERDRFDEVAQEVEYGGLRLVLRRNEAVCRKRHRRRQAKLAQLHQLIAERNALVAGSQRARPEAGLRRLSHWVKRHQLSACVTLSLQGRELTVQIDEEKQAEVALLDGCYVLETDVTKDHLDAQTVDARYRDLQKVERDFRLMKTALLEVRPLFVRKQSRTHGHVLAAMLALRLARELDRCFNAAFGTTAEGDTAMPVQDALQALSRLCFQRHQTSEQTFLTLPLPDHKQEAIFNAVNLKPPHFTRCQPAMM